MPARMDRMNRDAFRGSRNSFSTRPCRYAARCLQRVMTIAMAPTHFGPCASATASAQHWKNTFDWCAHSFGIRVNGWIPATDKM